MNGVADIVRRVATLPTVSNIWIGGGDAPVSDFYGQIQDVRIYTSVKYPGPFVPTVVRFTYVAPTSLSALTFTGQPTLQVGVMCTITLVGTDFNPASVVVSRLTVHVFDTTGQTTKPAVPNCLVTNYNISSGIITFKATPSTTGTSRRIVVFVDPPDGGLSVVLEETTNLTVTIAPVRTITSSAGALSTRVFDGNTYTAIRNNGTITIAGGTLIGEVLMVAGGGGSPSVSGGAPGAGGIAYSIAASIFANNYGVTIGAGGAAAGANGVSGNVGENTSAFGITVYGGGNDQGNGGSSGGATNGSPGTVLPATGTSTIGTYTSFGNRGGNVIDNGQLYLALTYSGGGGAGGPGGDSVSSVGGGAGGVGKNTWSDWLAACGIGEGDTNNKYWIGGGGGGGGNEVSGQIRARAGGLGGGGRGGSITNASAFRTGPLFAGLATNAIPYSGGGGGSGIMKDGTWTTGTEQYATFHPAGSGGSGVIIIKQYGVAVAPTIATAPGDVTGLVVWLDGNDPAGTGTPPSNNAGIATWVDKVAGNSHSATANSTQATYKAAGTVGGIKNTCGTMFFSNTGYKIPYTTFPQNHTIISIFRVERCLNTNGTLMDWSNTGSCYVLSGPTEYVTYFGMYNGIFQAGVGNGGGWLNGGITAATPSTYIRGQWVIATMTYNSSTKVTSRFVNGITMTTTTDTIAQNNGSTWNDMYIGGPSASGPNYRFNGYIGEILIYNSVLTNTDRLKVEGYLSTKYGFGVSV